MLTVLVHKAWGGHYLNQYAVDILPGQDPDVIAKQVGCENTGEYVFVFTILDTTLALWCFIVPIDPKAVKLQTLKKL